MGYQLSRRRALAGLLAGLLNPCAQAKAEHDRGPPLWIATRQRTEVYLFGQMPVPNNTPWLSSAVQQAFERSSELWTENPDPSAGPPPKPPASGGPKLSVVATQAEMERFRNVALREGLAAGAVDATLLNDAYSAVTWLSDHAIRADYTAIPERVLRARAKAIGKPTHSEWLSFEDVAEFQTSLPPDTHRELQLELFRRGLDEAENVATTKRWLSDWSAGDLRSLNEAQERNRQRFPLLERLIGTDRNQAWVPRVATITARVPTAFVCVGIGHLLGSSSIQAFLEHDGYQVRRV